MELVHKIKQSVIFIIIFIALGLIFLQINNSPKIILWAWERPENLLFANEKISVAFYAGGIILTDKELNIRPRMQPLFVNPKIPIIAVVRIDNLSRNNNFNNNHLNQISEFIIDACSQKNITGCQIDFDAKVSERNFYKKLLINIKNKLPQSIFLSITALVSWCNQNTWIEDLPIKEAVAMFYRLGPDEYAVRNNLTGADFMKAKMCQKSIGISTDEPLPKDYLKNKNIYIFNPESWGQKDFLNILELINMQ